MKKIQKITKSQSEAVKEVMESNGGYITLQKLYIEVLKIEGVKWEGTKDYSANIRCLLQRRKKDFFKVKPGLWALNSYKNKLPRNVQELIDEDKNDHTLQKDSTHYYYQGQVVEIGNMRYFVTYVPSQDKNRPYLEKTLKDIASTVDLPEFTFNEILRKVKNIDVIWFNNRSLPVNVFEIENTTKFQGALAKFCELKEFATEMTIVSSDEFREKFDEVKNMVAYRDIKNRVKFVDYQKVEQHCGGLNQMLKSKF
jgi:hypothetical protein